MPPQSAQEPPFTYESRILVVEDDATIAGAVASRLRSEGFPTEIAGDGPSAVARFHAGRPDLVILDIMLPGFDGLEVCRRIQAERPVPVLMLTARTEETDQLVGLGVGADDYLTKPFSMRVLVARVRALLRRAERHATPRGTEPEALPAAGTAAPVASTGTTPATGAGTAPVASTGTTPATGAGTAPVASTGTTPAGGTGTAPAWGTKAAPGVDTGSARRDGTAPAGHQVPGPAPEAVLRLGPLEVNQDTRRVHNGGEEVHLTPTEFALLCCLASAPGSVFTRARLLARVWEGDWDWADATHTRAVDSHIKALRRKLGAGLIRTVHGVGYALEVPP